MGITRLRKYPIDPKAYLGRCFVDIFGVITKLNYIEVSFLCILGSFLKVKVQNGGYFLGLVKFQIFFGVREIPDIFFG